MINMWKKALILVLEILLIFSGKAYADDPKTPEEHLSLAKVYEEKAEVQKKMMVEIKKEKEAYEHKMIRRSGKEVKHYPYFRIHLKQYNELLKRAKKLMQDYKKQAQWHRIKAEAGGRESP